jgi:hypothetical protein
MPLQLEIIRATEFIRVGAQGRFDLAASKAALATLASACQKRGLQHAVIDLRALQPGPKPVFSRMDLSELVNTFPEVGFTRRLRLAILYKSDPHRRARMFAFLSALHGWNVRAFGEFEEALLWLSRGQEAAAGPGRSPYAKAIPVRFGSRDADAPIRAGFPPMRGGNRRRRGKRVCSTAGRRLNQS